MMTNVGKDIEKLELLYTFYSGDVSVTTKICRAVSINVEHLLIL